MDKQKWQEIKDKLPSLGEVGSMASKLFKDIKKSVTEIAEDYKTKHPSTPEAPSDTTTSKPEDKKPEDDQK